jgi:hypothetical protein
MLKVGAQRSPDRFACLIHPTEQPRMTEAVERLYPWSEEAAASEGFGDEEFRYEPAEDPSTVGAGLTEEWSNGKDSTFG